MLIRPEPLNHWIDNFYGYGSWEARVWFIAYEESGGDLPEDVADKLNYFHSRHSSARTPNLLDIRDVYKNVGYRSEGPRSALFSDLFEYRFGVHAVQHGFWKNLIAFTHAYLGERQPDLLQYQKDSFASPALKKESWIQLYPLPSTHNHAWYYSWLDLPDVKFLKSRQAYEEHVYEKRIASILNKISTHKPEVVVMYGMNNITGLKESVRQSFPSINFKSIKGIKLEVPQHHLTMANDTKLIITTQIPGLKHGRTETGFDWEGFGRTVRSGSLK
jgi:hypothetical protein